ncbi:hypothetical protein [Photobacterium halotolerans]|uniref:hypothetical protein n=1 Tax=Photobacterium halotolerans TaxID=265726 RepID=UPI001372917C|nr:hypothetical protein [Photobacterium halotolerans]NAW86318.1 hypothetical protein [Photobacterium halotolerans]
MTDTTRQTSPDRTSWNAIVPVLSVALTILAACIGYLFIQTAANKLAISEQRAYVAENYATRDELKAGFDRLEQRLTDGFNRLDEKLERVKP